MPHSVGGNVDKIPTDNTSLPPLRATNGRPTMMNSKPQLRRDVEPAESDKSTQTVQPKRGDSSKRTHHPPYRPTPTARDSLSRSFGHLVAARTAMVDNAGSFGCSLNSGLVSAARACNASERSGSGARPNWRPSHERRTAWTTVAPARAKARAASLTALQSEPRDRTSRGGRVSCLLRHWQPSLLLEDLSCPRSCRQTNRRCPTRRRPRRRCRRSPSQ